MNRVTTPSPKKSDLLGQTDELCLARGGFRDGIESEAPLMRGRARRRYRVSLSGISTLEPGEQLALLFYGSIHTGHSKTKPASSSLFSEHRHSQFQNRVL